MKKLISFCLLILLFAACERGYVGGIEYNNVPKEELRGGWGVTDINFQLVYNAANPVAFIFTTFHLDDKLKEMLENRTRNVSLYFMKDTFFCIKECNTETEHVSDKSYYTVASYPAVIHPENKTVLCDSYSDSIFVKMEYNEERDTTLILYFLKKNVIKLIREDGSVEEKHVEMIENNIDDAQFEIYMKRNHLSIYKDLEEYYGE